MGKTKPRTRIEFTDEMRKEASERWGCGESFKELAKEFGIKYETMKRGVHKYRTERDPDCAVQPRDDSLAGFVKQARSVLWAIGDDEHKTYYEWKKTVDLFRESQGHNVGQAAIRASKNYPILHDLFTQYDVKAFDPFPDSHPEIRFCEPREYKKRIKCERKEMPYRDNLAWAISAAGEFQRSGAEPSVCPNDAAFFLYQQARTNPKDFMSKFGQVESKIDESNAYSEVATRLSISEINEMLDTILEERENELGLPM